MSETNTDDRTTNLWDDKLGVIVTFADHLYREREANVKR